MQNQFIFYVPNINVLLILCRIIDKAMTSLETGGRGLASQWTAIVYIRIIFSVIARDDNSEKLIPKVSPI